MIIDTHCHLHFKSFDKDREDVISRCIERGLVMNTVGTQQSSCITAVELADRHEQIYATVGLHPVHHHKVRVDEESACFISKCEEFDANTIEELLNRSSKVIAIGETGLDAYHVPKDQDLHEVLNKQWELFLKHVDLARKHNLPLVIHVRDCHEEMIKRLKDVNIKQGGVMHCYTDNWKQAKEYLSMGFYLGFTGVITFPPKKTNPKPQLDLTEVVKKMPIDRMLVETDAPFLAPQKYRGKRSEPWMVEQVIAKVSEVKGMAKEEVRQITTENARQLFKKMTV